MSNVAATNPTIVAVPGTRAAIRLLDGSTPPLPAYAFKVSDRPEHIQRAVRRGPPPASAPPRGIILRLERQITVVLMAILRFLVRTIGAHRPREWNSQE
jgi:hypothetical protein